ncbi:MAG: putative MetA-pathway of phenol degradation [Pseudomonadota bacterium]
MIKRLVILGTFVVQLYGVHIGTATHLPDTLLVGQYFTLATADNLKNIDGDVTTNQLGYELFQYTLRPILYQGDFVYQIILPYKKQELVSLDENRLGLGDITIGVGYFIPNDFEDTELGVLFNLQLPTGRFDPSKTINNGSGHYSSSFEFYLHKTIGRVIFDGAVKYKYHFKNNDTSVKLGDSYAIESVCGYVVSRNFVIGPNLSYQWNNDNETNAIEDLDTYSSRWNFGVEGILKLNEKMSLLVGGYQDFNAKNTFEATTILISVFYSF